MLDSKVLSAVEIRFLPHQTSSLSVSQCLRDGPKINCHLSLSERLSPHAIHDHHVATLGPKAMEYRTMTCHLRETTLGTADVTLDLEPSSHHLTSARPTGISWHPWRKAVLVRARTCPGHPYLTRYRRWKAHQIARVHTRSSRWASHLLSAAQKVRRVAFVLSAPCIRSRERNMML
jgi:hypothetical protein